jgi:uncharacterized protein
MKRDDLLDLNDALQHPGRVVAVDISTEMPDEADVDLVRPLEGFLEAVSTGNVLLVTGKFTTRAVLECSRCSGPIEQDVEFEVDEQFPVAGTPSSYASTDYARISPDDEPYELFEGNNLIVEALLRQNMIINMPIQTLCEFGWDGVCPIALQRGASPKTEVKRPEFAQLASLLEPEVDA